MDGKKITGDLNVTSGSLEIQGNGGQIVGIETGLVVGMGASAEVNDTTIIGGSVGIMNYGPLKLVDGKVQGREIAIINLYGFDGVDILGGEILSDGIAIANVSGKMIVGNSDGSGPVITADTGILNIQMDLEGGNHGAVVSVKGGTICAATDIVNRTEVVDLGAQGELAATAGTVVLSGGTFRDGLTAKLDDGVDLKDLLATGADYWMEQGQRAEVADGAVSVDGTIIVHVECEDESCRICKDPAGQDKNPTGGDGSDQDKNPAGGNASDQDKKPASNGSTVATGDSTLIGLCVLFMIGAALTAGVIIHKKYR